jgi:hypothetical protein
MVTELVPKRLEMLKALVPTLRRVWAVYHADDLSSRSAPRRAAEVAPRLNLELLDRGVRNFGRTGQYPAQAAARGRVALAGEHEPRVRS